jgi:glycosyltransferase involved in cell wall biosynthesis
MNATMQQLPGVFPQQGNSAPSGLCGGADAVLFVVPAHDEERTVGAVVRDIRKRFSCEVVVVDDASRDATAGEALAAGASVLPLPVRSGAWCAVQAGFRYALARGARLAVTLDADGQHLPETVGPLLEEMRRGRADVVIGGCPSRGGPLRRAALAILRRLGRLGVGDLTSGLRVYNARAMAALLAPRAVRLDYQDIGVLLLLRRAGLAVAEVTVPMRPRAHGRSRIFRSPDRMLAYLWHSALLCVRAGEDCGCGLPGDVVSRRLELQGRALQNARLPGETGL